MSLFGYLSLLTGSQMPLTKVHMNENRKRTQNQGGGGNLHETDTNIRKNGQRGGKKKSTEIYIRKFSERNVEFLCVILPSFVRSNLLLSWPLSSLRYTS